MFDIFYFHEGKLAMCESFACEHVYLCVKVYFFIHEFSPSHFLFLSEV